MLILMSTLSWEGLRMLLSMLTFSLEGLLMLILMVILRWEGLRRNERRRSASWKMWICSCKGITVITTQSPPSPTPSPTPTPTSSPSPPSPPSPWVSPPHHVRYGSPLQSWAGRKDCWGGKRRSWKDRLANFYISYFKFLSCWCNFDLRCLLYVYLFK